VNACRDSTNLFTALHFAAQAGEAPAVELLAANGTDLEVRKPCGRNRSICVQEERWRDFQVSSGYQEGLEGLGGGSLVRRFEPTPVREVTVALATRGHFTAVRMLGCDVGAGV
jgi:ankyrin repeat protein